VNVQVTPELITAAASLVTAIGFAVKQMRDHRRERRERKTQLERVARAAAKGPERVAELVDESERTGEFTRPTGPGYELLPRARAPKRAPGRRDT
jgi:hypothetical protein